MSPIVAGIFSIFSGTITLGATIVALFVVGFAGFFATKNKVLESAQRNEERASSEASNWRDNYLAERQLNEDNQKRCAEALAATERRAAALLLASETRAADLLAAAEARYEEQLSLKDALLTENAGLKMATDLSVVMKMLAAVEERITAMEERMAARLEAFGTSQQAQTAALEAIVRNLGGSSSPTDAACAASPPCSHSPQ